MTESNTVQTMEPTRISLPFWGQLRWQLTLAFLLLGILPVFFVTAVILNRTSEQATSQIYDQLDSVAELKSDQILRWLDEGNLAMDTLLSGSDSIRFANFAAADSTNPREQADLNEILMHAVETQYFSRVFIYNTEGLVVASSDPADIGKNISSQPFFEISLHADYIQSPLVEPESNRTVMYITRPLRGEKIQASGVLAGELNIDSLADIMTERTGLGESGETYLVNLSNNNLLTPSRFQGYAITDIYHSDGIDRALRGERGHGAYDGYRKPAVAVFGSYRFIPELQAALLAEVDQSQALGTFRQVQWISSVIAAMAILAALVVGLYTSRSISRPIHDLTVSAQRIGSGELKAEIMEQRRQDEIGLLARTFNQMQGELVASYEKLEQRVAERTKALATVAEVATAASTILDTNTLLQEAVDLSKERFSFYHAHIYLLNAAGDALVLASGAGEVGRRMVEQGHAIPIDREQSLVTRAVRERKGVAVNDVTLTPDFLPNPLLPETRSELAVPMIVGEQVIGVFDVQSDVVGRFTDADINVQTTLASQIAAAVQNARSYTEFQRSQDQLSEALNISRLAYWEYDVTQDLFTFNDHFYSLFGTSAEKVGGYRISSADYARNFVHPEDAPIVGAEIQKVVASTERHSHAAVEHRMILEDGQLGYMSVHVNIDRDENGRILRWYGTNQDVTERRRLEELNRKRAFQQEALNRITQKIQSTTKIETALKIAARELGHTLGMKPTLVTLETNHEQTAGPASKVTSTGASK